MKTQSNVIAFISFLTLSCSEDVETKLQLRKHLGLSLLTPTSSFNLVLDGAKLNDIATTFVWNDIQIVLRVHL
jgi:hypothetical protein